MPGFARRDHENAELEFRVFDPSDEYDVVERKLPHWTQPGTLCFITFRTFDSIPKSIVERFFAERLQWLERYGIEAGCDLGWRTQLARMEPDVQRQFHTTFSRRWHNELDNCYGECVLRDPSLGQIVADSLTHFDGDRYELTDFVIMPNHVHLTAAFRDAEQMLTQCESWKHFTARQLNRRLSRRGRFWQQDGYDHLIRSARQFEYLRRYIAENPVRAKLRAGEFIHLSKQLR